MFTSSRNSQDVDACYNMQANGYVVKPTKVEEHKELAAAIDAFWFNVAILPVHDGDV